MARRPRPHRARSPRVAPNGGRTLARRCRLAARGVLLLGALLVGAGPAGAQSSEPAAARTYEGAVVYPAPTGDAYYYFKYVQDSVLVLGEGISGEPRVALPHASFVSLLRALHQTGALRDTVALRYALEAQFAPAAPGDLAVAVQVPALAALMALALGLALVAVGVLYRRVRRGEAARARERALRLRLAEAREAERTHFARELHDGPLQDLCALQLALGGAGSAAARTAVADVVADLRGLCDRLRPPSLAAFGLPAALEGLAERVARQHPDLRVACRVETDAALPPLPADRQLALFRIAQEALANVAHHAGASRAEVALALAPGAFRLTIDDDGAGPPVRDALDYAAEGHYGLLGMRERADLLGAALAVGPSPLGGTRIAIERGGDAAARAERLPRASAFLRRRRAPSRRAAPAI